ncbi:hypothetical protein PQQ84_03735 [Paraburkholderia strydomiana]|jgi:hypothetical protein|uniref:hypothetical protein n=1 Tax=Paraburkholderia strydomiana TaxID=1245417 RepID=UPI0038B8A2D5
MFTSKNKIDTGGVGATLPGSRAPLPSGNSPDFPRRRDAHIIEAFADKTSDKGAVRRPFAIT